MSRGTVSSPLPRVGADVAPGRQAPVTPTCSVIRILTALKDLQLHVHLETVVVRYEDRLRRLDGVVLVAGEMQNVLAGWQVDELPALVHGRIVVDRVVRPERLGPDPDLVRRRRNCR